MTTLLYCNCHRCKMFHITIRAGSLTDVKNISSIHALCWREVYSFMPDAVISARNTEYRAKQWCAYFDQQKPGKLFVVECKGDVVGFCFCCPNNDSEIDAKGEMHAAYVLPEYRGKLVGPLMMREMAKALKNAAQSPMCLWAFKDNPIRIWYAQMGWKRAVERDRQLVGHAIPEVGYVCHDTQALIIRLERIVASAAQTG